MSGPRVGGNGGRYEQATKAILFRGTALRVVKIVDERGITRTDLARKTGLSQGTIQAIVQGTAITYAGIVAVARALGVTVDDLVPEEVST